MDNTREKMIDVFMHIGDHVRSLDEYGVCFDSTLAKAIEDVVAMLKNQDANGVTLDNQVSSSKWIPVTERLPEDDFPKDTKRQQIRCLVATDKGTVKPCVRQRCISRKVKGVWVMTPWEWNKNTFAEPTYWMPLPEAPTTCHMTSKQPPKGE